MADKLVAVRIKQQDNTYSNEIPIGTWAENVAYDDTKNLLQVLGTIDMYKGDVQTQLNALFENFNNIAENITGAIDNWITDNMPSWNPEDHLDFSLTSSTQAAAGSAVPKLIAINEGTIDGTKIQINTIGQNDLTVLTPNDIDNTLSQQGEVADAKATGEMIMINNAAAAGTKIRITTTSEDISLATEKDINNLEVYNSTIVSNLTEVVTGNWKSGTITPGGRDLQNVYRIKTNGFLNSDIVRINPINGYHYCIYVYNQDEEYQGVAYEADGTIIQEDYSWRTSPTYLPTIGNYKFRIVAYSDDSSKPDSSNIILEKMTNIEELKDEVVNKIAKPTTSPDGTNGQILQANGDGTTTWIDQSDITSEIQAEVSLKINRPGGASPDGTNGQILKTNGDGTTTWIDQGLPTTEQTKSAVEHYLNEHRDEWTTVADESLTAEKFSALLQAQAIKDYVTPEMFIDDTDPAGDDTPKIQRAIQYATTYNVPLFFPPKTYKVYKTLSITAGNKLYISGFGSNSVIEANPRAHDGFSDGDSVFHIYCKGSGLKDTYVGNFAIHFSSPIKEEPKLQKSIIGIRVKGNPGPNALFENLHIHDNERETNNKVGIEIYELDTDTYVNDKGETKHLSTESTCVTFRRIVGRYIKGAGIACGSAHSTLFTECDMVHCDYGIYLGGGSNITIANCRLDEALFGIYCNGSQDPNAIYPETKLERYKQSQGSPHNLTIRNNRFENTNTEWVDAKYNGKLRAGIMLIAFGSNTDSYMLAQNINIFGNFFDGMIVSEEQGLNIHGMILTRINSITINNNDFKARNGNGTADGGLNILTTPGDIASVLDNISLFMNRCLKLSDKDKVQSNTELPTKLLNRHNGLLNNLEYNQSTVPTHMVVNQAQPIIGDMILDNNKPCWWTGEKWVYADGTSV